MKLDKIYKFILEFYYQQGRTPLQAEIGRAFGYKSAATAHGHVLALVERGMIHKIGRHILLPGRLDKYEKVKAQLAEIGFDISNDGTILEVNGGILGTRTIKEVLDGRKKKSKI